VRQLTEAEAPVYERLRQNSATAAALQQLEQVVGGLPAAMPLTAPAWCRDTDTAGQRR
jgi:hypothetical protein